LNQQEDEMQQNSYDEIALDAIDQEERNKAGTKDLIWGFLSLVGGAVITLIMWAATEPGHSFWVMTGAIVFGAFWILRGLYRKITSNKDDTIRLMWILGGILVVGTIVGGAIAITNMMTQSMPTPPSDSFILFEDNSAWKDEVSDIVTISGTVTNTHSEWSIVNVNVELEAIDTKGDTVKTFSVPVAPGKLTPGGQGVYDTTITVPTTCVRVKPFLSWEWEPP
jgi:hypothetical protein